MHLLGNDVDPFQSHFMGQNQLSIHGYLVPTPNSLGKEKDPPLVSRRSRELNIL